MAAAPSAGIDGMSGLAPSLWALRQAVRDYVSGFAPDIEAFCGAELQVAHKERILPAQAAPVAARLDAMRDQTAPLLAPLVNAVIAAAPDVCWRQSYTEADPGFGRAYLDNYGWFNLIAPSGPFVSDRIRVSVGYWEKGLLYPMHWHEPEEIYLTLAGSAEYVSQGRTPVVGGPGTTICHFSNQPHAVRFKEAALLALAFWRGAGLEAKSELGPA